MNGLFKHEEKLVWGGPVPQAGNQLNGIVVEDGFLDRLGQGLTHLGGRQ
jgi:hypothetical protein